MKRIALKTVTFQLPKDIRKEILMSAAKAEEAMRENNRLIEQAINNIATDSMTVNQDASGYLHIS